MKKKPHPTRSEIVMTGGNTCPSSLRSSITRSDTITDRRKSPRVGHLGFLWLYSLSCSDEQSHNAEPM